MVIYLFLDLASGGAYDWMKKEAGIKFSYTYEMRPGMGTNNGFVLPENEIPYAINEAFASLGTFSERINEFYMGNK